MAQYDLFISYTDADRAWVEGYLFDVLKQADVNYCSEADFVLGKPRILQFEEAIKSSRRTLLVISPAYLADWTDQFLEVLGLSYGLDTATWPVIPLILHPVELPPRLNLLVNLDATDLQQWEEALRRLCADLEHPFAPILPPPECPYPGMVPFNEADSDRFFGRDREIEELLERLRVSNFVTVIGPSGSGKSSLVMAGLIPALRRSGFFGAGEWAIYTMRPGTTPLINLRSALGNDLTRPAQAVAHLIAAPSQSRRLLLVVDQFEELFTSTNQPSIASTDQEVLLFQQTLLRLIEVPNCYIVLIVRADFYADLMVSPLWRQIKTHRLEVTPLDEKGLREAIIKPAENVGVFVESALVERLVTDADREPGILPLVQETLVLLWEHIERRFLPLRAYEALVLPRHAYGPTSRSPRTGLQVAIVRRADAAIGSLRDDKQEMIARRIFLRLIQFCEGRADTRRQQPVRSLQSTGEDPGLFDETLFHLVDSRLLTISGKEAAERKVDVAHEALISGWPMLQQWITERREAEQTRRRLTAKAEEWVQLGRGKGGLLDEVELLEAEQWLKRPDAEELGYDQILSELILASRDAIEEAKREKLEQEKRATEQERIARKASQVRNRVAVVSVALLTGLSVIAAKQEIEVIHGLRASSALLFASNQQLEALVESIKAGKRLESLSFLYPFETKIRVADTLRQIVYGIRERNRLEGHQAGVNSIAFSRNGQMLASASKDGTIRLWNQDGQEPKTLKGHDGSVWYVRFSPDGKLIASAGNDDDYAVRLWNVAKGETLTSLKGHSGRVFSVDFSPVDREESIVTASEDGTVRLWSREGRFLKILGKHSDLVLEASFSPNGQKIASASVDGIIRVWDLQGNVLAEFNHKDKPLLAISFSPEDQILASVDEKGTIKLWNLVSKSSEPIVTIKETVSRGDVPLDIAFSPNGKILASTSGQAIKLLRVSDGKLLQTLKGHKEPVKAVRFNPQDGQIIASAGNDRIVRIWSVSGISPVLFEQLDSVNEVSFSPDDKTIAFASSDGTVKFLNPTNGKLLQSLEEHQEPVNGVSFSPDGKTLASASHDGTVKLWDPTNGKLLQSLKKEQNRAAILGLNFSPDSKLLALAVADSTVELWHRSGPSFQHQKSLQGHNGSVYGVTFNPQGTAIASVGRDGAVKLWNVSGDLLTTFEGHEDAIRGVSFSRSPSDITLVSAGFDGKIMVWNLNLDDLLALGCNWLSDYLENNPKAKASNSNLCNGIN